MYNANGNITTSYTPFDLLRQESSFEASDKFIRLLSKCERENCMGQYPSQMGAEALVQGEDSFSLDGLRKAVNDALVLVASLVIQSIHRGVRWMHNQTNHKATSRTA